jgi:3-hydroxyacyl-CoA dehydrogenase/enoyl-CoA hydratase/3-hydroxybutyryl-CoA epimerase
LRGHTVTLQDREQKYVDPAMERAAKLFEKRIRDESARAAATERLQSDVEGAGAARADLVIEAIFENLEAKQALYGSLQAKMPAGALLATNTSSIRLEELREGLEAPQRFIGLHFFNPVAQLPLVEVIRCKDTDQDALDIGFSFVKGIGKLPLECMSSPGFVVNRILAPYMAEAMELAESATALGSTLPCMFRKYSGPRWTGRCRRDWPTWSRPAIWDARVARASIAGRTARRSNRKPEVLRQMGTYRTG